MFTPEVERLVTGSGSWIDNWIDVLNPPGPGQAGAEGPGHCAEATADSR